jgi:hypothetical protein
MQPATPPKMPRNVRAKSKLENKSFKEQKGKQPLQQTNQPRATAMTTINLKYVKGKSMSRSSVLCQASQYCLELHNYYINNYKMSDNIVVEYKKPHFVLADDIFVVSFSDLYDIFILDALDISLMRFFTL